MSTSLKATDLVVHSGIERYRSLTTNKTKIRLFDFVTIVEHNGKTTTGQIMGISPDDLHIIYSYTKIKKIQFLDIKEIVKHKMHP